MKKLLLFILISISAFAMLSCTTAHKKIEPSNNQAYNKIETITPTDEKNDEEINISSYALQAESIEYLGAFCLPSDGETEREMYSYGGEAMCFNPHNNSLFITGHNWFADIAEISIPEPIISKDITQLNKAEVLQNFSDVKGSLFDDWSMEIIRAGLEVVGDKLFFCYGQHFEEEKAQGTHGYADLNLTEADSVCTVGDKRYTTNDYMFSIPQNYLSSFDGADLLTGRFRDGGWGGMGPSLYALRTEDIVNAQTDEKIKAVPVIGYDDSYDGDEGYKMHKYSHADSWSGGAFISCDAGDAIIFVGTHGYGETWYGFSNGVVYPVSGDEDEKIPEVPDYPHDERGWWNDDFRACIAFYDVEEALNVIEGRSEPYEMQPYSFLDLSDYMLVERDETAMHYLGGSAYDIQNNRLYILELFADGDKPLVHVFTFR